jgi:thymidine phosphorylase
MDKRVQALITDMNQPLGYAIGNALEVMEASQTCRTPARGSDPPFAGAGRANDLPR